MLATLKLARWLGPWADAHEAPRVTCAEDNVAGTRVRYYGRPGGATFLIAPGLHYAGPDDPRMDRFCRILAAAGHYVVAPFIADYLALMPGRRAIDELGCVFDSVAVRKPIVFSISFGSLLAFALAARRGADIDKLIVFGGYADFHDTMRFCLTGEVASGRSATRDPLNQPVVLMNLLDHLDLGGQSASGPLDPGHVREHREDLIAAWRRYVERTWGRPEMKARERFVAIAEELAPEVPERVRELFLIGIGARPGAWDLALPALARFDASALDPSPYLPLITNRVELVHGMDDDVIPFEQSYVLASRLTAADVRVHITGLYGHTGAQRPPLAALGKELVTMMRVLRVLAG